MNNQEAIEAIKLAQAQVEWDYPMEYAAAFDMAISALQEKDVPDTNVGDIASRQKAIEALEKIPVREFKKTDGLLDALVSLGRVYKALKQLPSAQPEPSEITDEQAILHLQSTGWMQNHDREMYESGLRKQLADDSGSYDSIIPFEDTISRAAAIDAVIKDSQVDGAYGYMDTKSIVDLLNDLPSAQPEQSIPISWIEKQIDWLKSMDNEFSNITAMNISVLVKRWRKENGKDEQFY